ncbi:MAG: hypothetical protein HOM55_10765 [Proteobacteria bacterium]|jgi:hypothetical protein|nr:hypothetical protein [Pseudomonadota bacterium]
MNRLVKNTVIILLGVALLACGANGYVIGVLYERLDDEIEKSIREYADLTPGQDAWLKEEVAAFHYWHRTTQLPRYADWARTSLLPLVTSDHVNRLNVDQIVLDGIAFSDDFNAEFPINKSPEILLSIMPDQMIQARAHVEEIYLEAGERRDKRTQEARVERQVDRMTSAFKQIGWRLSAEQKGIMTRHFEGRAIGDDDEGEDWSLWHEWVQQLFAILERKKLGQENDPANIAELKGHLAIGNRLTQHRSPETWQKNLDRFQSMIHTLLGSMTDKQKLAVEVRMLAIADILDELSQKGVEPG